MNIKTKYDINQKLYILNELSYRKTCPMCKGATNIVLENELIDCPLCHGSGWVWSKDNKWLVNVYYIHEICADVDDSGELITYEVFRDREDQIENPSSKIPNGFNNIHEDCDDVFSTREKAEKECNKRNAIREK